jgi:uncharacterized protein (TIGR02246 family)
MPSRVILLAIILLAITSGCVGINVNAAQSQDETSIREILRLQTEAWNRGDSIAWAKEFTDDSDFVNMRGNTLHGRGEITATITASLQGRLKGSHLSLAIRQFHWLTPDVALVETDCEITGLQGGLPGIAPTTEGILKTRLTYVAVRRDKDWHFVAAQNTPVLPSPKP